MRLRYEALLRQAAWAGALALLLLAGKSAYAQELRNKVKALIVADDAAPQEFEFTVDLAEDVQLGDDGLFTIAGFPDEENANPSTYWIGVMCNPADDVLRAHLQLPEKQGLVVAEVVKDSPAAGAGVQVHDVFIMAGDQPLSDGHDLVKLVEDTKDNDLRLRIIRGGQPQVIVVRPAKRPPQEAREARVEIAEKLGGDAQKHILRLFGNAGAARMANPMRMHVFQPGRLFQPGGPLPDNMSVTVTKSGKEPAKITVKQGDKSWEVSEDKLGDLPDDVRGEVQKLLGRMPHEEGGLFAFPGGENEFELNIVEGVGGEGQPPGRVRRRIVAPGFGQGAKQAEGDLQHQIADLSKQIEALRKAIEAMQKQ